MLSKYRVHDVSGWTMFIFGVLAVLMGAAGILQPEILLQLLGFEVVEQAQRSAHDYTRVFLTASSMASFNMGIYYVLAALNNLKQFYGWTVPFRMVTFTVFTLVVVSGSAPSAFIGVAAWELIGALATGAALLYERQRQQ